MFIHLPYANLGANKFMKSIKSSYPKLASYILNRIETAYLFFSNEIIIDERDPFFEEFKVVYSKVTYPKNPEKLYALIEASKDMLVGYNKKDKAFEVGTDFIYYDVFTEREMAETWSRLFGASLVSDMFIKFQVANPETHIDINYIKQLVGMQNKNKWYQLAHNGIIITSNIVFEGENFTHYIIQR